MMTDLEIFELNRQDKLILTQRFINLYSLRNFIYNFGMVLIIHNQMELKYQYFLIIIGIIFYVFGRICDDINWYTYPGISPNTLQGLSTAGLSVSAFIILIVRLNQEQGDWKWILLQSQIKFIIPWALAILLCYLDWKVFGCNSHPQQLTGQQMDYTGCVRYSVVILLSNLNYSLICHTLGELPLLITFEIILFAQVIYSGFLLVSFIDTLHHNQKQKDLSILFVSVFIAWQTLVMDLIYRGSFEDKNHQQRHQRLQQVVHSHHSRCHILIGSEYVNTNKNLNKEIENIHTETLIKINDHIDNHPIQSQTQKQQKNQNKKQKLQLNNKDKKLTQFDNSKEILQIKQQQQNIKVQIQT